MKAIILLIPVLLAWLFSSFLSISPSVPAINTISDTIKEIKVTQLENAMDKLIKVGITGIPGVIESTNDRTLRYLQDNENDVTLALEKAASRISRPLNKLKRAALTNIPYLGLPYSLLDPYWQKTRYLLLVAKLNNHDINSQKVNDNIMYCLTNTVKNTVEQKVENKILGKVLDYVDKIFGIKFFTKVGSVPLSVLNIFLEKNNEIIECGRMKFGY